MRQSERRDVVVFVHGLWMAGHEFFLMRQRVGGCGYDTRRFRYRSVLWDFSRTCRELKDFLDKLPADRVYFVAHSLGGLVLRHFFSRYNEPRAVGAVLLGTPNTGSAVADALYRKAWGRKLLGRSYAQGLDGQVPPWPTHLPVGIIAGNLPLGAGRLFCDLSPPHDGTVRVSETPLPQMIQQLILPVSHTSMLFSPLVARNTCHFLRYGRFAADT